MIKNISFNILIFILLYRSAHNVIYYQPDEAGIKVYYTYVDKKNWEDCNTKIDPNAGKYRRYV